MCIIISDSDCTNCSVGDCHSVTHPTDSYLLTSIYIYVYNGDGIGV